MTETELILIIREFEGHSFSTLDFINKLKLLYPSKLEALIKKYGKGGKGAGRHYSAYSRVAQYLNQIAQKGNLEKLDYRKAPPEWGNPIIRYWYNRNNSDAPKEYPEEIDTPEKVIEGAKQTIIVNRYERNESARRTCIKKWGTLCFACGFDFERSYGSRGQDLYTYIT